MPVFLCLFEISWQSNNCFSFLAKIISPATRKKKVEINFRIRGISRGERKLIRTHILIIIKKGI